MNVSYYSQSKGDVFYCLPFDWQSLQVMATYSIHYSTTDEVSV